MNISYDVSLNAWLNYNSYIENMAVKPNVKKICEIGGGANPSLSLDFIKEHHLEYTILDISEEELAKSPDYYSKVQADITSTNLNLERKYDFVFTKMLAEHVKNGFDFHQNVFNLLEKGGYAFHFFPTLYALPYVLNILLPTQLSESAILLLQPFRIKEGNHAKFVAYYSWCKGPLKSQIRNFENLGYSVEEYIGFFGHAYYERIKPIHALHEFISSVLVKYPVPLMTSFAYVLLQKPEGPNIIR